MTARPAAGGAVAQPLAGYIRTQATVAAVVNMIVNPLVTWLRNLDRDPTPTGEVVTDMAMTCLIMSTLIAVFVTPATRRALAGGRLTDDTVVPAGPLAHLPARSLPLGLGLGAIAALVLVPLTWVALTVGDVDEVGFWALITFKLVWTGAVAYLVTTLVAWRQVAHLRSHRP